MFLKVHIYSELHISDMAKNIAKCENIANVRLIYVVKAQFSKHQKFLI